MNTKRLAQDPVTLAIRSGASSYKVCKLIPSKRDASILLHVYRDRSLHRGALAQAVVNIGDPVMATITYGEEKAILVPIAHQSIHASGEQHVKLVDNRYVSMGKGVPLAGLSKPRPLWTVVPGRFNPAMALQEEKGRIHGITEPPDTPARALNLFAIPKGTFGGLTIPFDLDDLAGQVPPPIYVEPVEFRFFDIVAFWYSTGMFTSPPPLTHVFPAIHDLSPFVRSLDERGMQIVFRQFTN